MGNPSQHDEVDELKRQLAQATAALSAIQDRLAIQDILNTYARGIDRGDIEVIKSVYHPAGHDEHGIFSGKGHDFAEFVVPYITANYRMMQHHHTTTSIDIQGLGANAETYFLCVQAKENNDLEFSAGRCADRFEKRDGVWGIVHRQVIMDWTWFVPAAEPTAIDHVFERGRFEGSDPTYRLLPHLRESGLIGRPA